MASRELRVLLVVSSPSSKESWHRTLRVVEDVRMEEDFVKVAEAAPLRPALQRFTRLRADEDATITHGARAEMVAIASFRIRFETEEC